MSQLTVRTMSKLSGVSAHTLRAWEKRYGALKPSRTQGGQRAYNMNDLERLRRLKRITELGYSIGQVAHLPDAELSNLLKGAEGAIEVVSRAELGSTVLPGLEFKNIITPMTALSAQERQPIEGIINNLAEFKLDEVYRSLTAARMRYGAHEFALKIASPILKEIGVLVDRGSMSISQEHAFSALLRDQLGYLIQSSKVSSSKDSVVFATSEGDLHDFGILLGQVLCLSHGLKTHNLGANLPLESLIFAVQALRVDHIVVSFADLPPGVMKVSPVEFVKTLRSRVPKYTTIIIAGRGLTHEMLASLSQVAIYTDSLADLDNIFKRIASHQ